MIHLYYIKIKFVDKHMPNIEITKLYLLVKRATIIKSLRKEGYSGSDIGVIFNIDDSAVSRIINNKPLSGRIPKRRSGSKTKKL